VPFLPFAFCALFDSKAKINDGHPQNFGHRQACDTGGGEGGKKWHVEPGFSPFH